MNTKLDAVLFDLDGTLVDTAPDFVIAANALRAEHKLPPLPPDEISPVVSNGAAAVTELALDLDNRKAPDFEIHRQNLLKHYGEALGKKSSIYCGLDDALRTIETAGTPWGVVTNKPLRYAEPLLEMLGLAKRCAVLICPDHVAVAKPDPEGLLLAIDRMQSQINANSKTGHSIAEYSMAAQQCLYVGDHLRDIDAAKAAGCPSVAATYGYIESHDDPESWGADFYTETSEKLSYLLTSLFRS